MFAISVHCLRVSVLLLHNNNNIDKITEKHQRYILWYRFRYLFISQIILCNVHNNYNP